MVKKLFNITIIFFIFLFLQTEYSISDSEDECIKKYNINSIELMSEFLKTNISDKSKSEIYFLLYNALLDNKYFDIHSYIFSKNPNYFICGTRFDKIKQYSYMYVVLYYDLSDKSVNDVDPQNLKRANDYLNFADLLGHPDAKAQVALNKITGMYQLKNLTAALEKALESAKLGSAKGQLVAGVLYADLGWYDKAGVYSTKGIREDLISAYMWLNISAMNNDRSAAESRDEIARKMSSSDISKAQKLSAKCLQSNYTDCQKGWW